MIKYTPPPVSTSGFIQDAYNGLSTDGLSPLGVVLGGVLTAVTTIPVGSQSFELTGTNLPANQYIDLLVDNTPGGASMFLTTKINSTNVQATINLQAAAGDTHMNLQVFNAANNETSFRLDPGQNGITVTDNISSLGMVYAGNYYTNAVTSPRAIPDWGGVQQYFGTNVVSGFKMNGIAVTTAVITYNVPAGVKGVYTLMYCLDFSSGVGTTSLSASWIDSAGSSISHTFTTLSAIGSNGNSPLTMYVNPSTTITITVNITGTTVANIAAQLINNF